ncbi:MAG: hypothetical protein WKF30_11325 [Pyrinomonadaceae bacterium]
MEDEKATSAEHEMKIKASEPFPPSAKPSDQGERKNPREAACAGQGSTLCSFSSVLGKRASCFVASEHRRSDVASEGEELNLTEKKDFRGELIFTETPRANELLEEDAAAINPRMTYSAAPLQPAPEVEESGAKFLWSDADLNRIVQVIETRIAIDGKREVTLEFSRATAHGLVVVLGSDPAGRLKIEFTAPNARLLAEIQSQLPELINQLHTRGVDAAHVQVPVNSKSGGESEKRQKRRQHHELLMQITTTAKTQGAQPNTDTAIGASVQSPAELKPASAIYHA